MKKINVLVSVISICLFFVSFASAKLFYADLMQKKDTPPKNETMPADSSLNPSPSSVSMDHDIYFVIDNSAGNKKNEPKNYLRQALRLFTSLLGESDKVGIISFSGSAGILMPLTQNLKDNREKFLYAADKISPDGMKSNLAEAIKNGFDGIKASQRKNRALILISGAKMPSDLQQDDSEAHKEMTGLFSDIANSGIKIYTIAITETADIGLFEDMAKKTGGFFWKARNNKEIPILLSLVFEKIKSPDSILLEEDGFTIDKDVKKAVVLVSKKPETSTYIVKPTGKMFTPMAYDENIQWYETNIFDLIGITKPSAGKWELNLSKKDGSRVFVTTDLNLKTSLDKGYASRNEKIKIDAWLERDGVRLTDAGTMFFSEIIDPQGKITRIDLTDTGAEGDIKTGDGIYAGEFTADLPGKYLVKIAAEGNTFNRQKVVQLSFNEQQQVESKEAVSESVPTLPMTDRDVVSWKQVLIKFGLINLYLIIAIAIIIIARKMIFKKAKRD